MNIKTIKQIVSNMIQWTIARTTKITDFNVGSVVRTLYESVAAEIEEVYYHLWNGFRDAVKKTIFYAFDFHYKEPTPAYVELVFTRIDTNDTSQPIYIPKGTIVSTLEGVYFETLEDCTIQTGETSCTVTAVSQLTGSINNVPEETITIIQSNDLQSSVSVINPQPASGGNDKETDEELIERFQEYIQSLARGTLSALEYGAKTVDGVVNATAIDRYIGSVNLYVWDSNGNLSDYLKEQVKNEMINWRAAGIEVNVLPPIKVNVDVELKVQVADLSLVSETTLKEQIEDAILAFNNSLTLGKALNISEIIHATMNVSNNIVDVKVISPEQDYNATEYQLIHINSVTISQITDSEI